MTIGEQIRFLRKHIGYTQKELGRLSGTSERTIQQYENGKREPRIKQLQKIAHVFGGTVFEIFAVGEEADALNENDLLKLVNPNPSIGNESLYKKIRQMEPKITFNQRIRDSRKTFINLINKTGWNITEYRHCLKNPACPLTDDEFKKKWNNENYPKEKCSECAYDKIDYMLYKHDCIYLLSEKEYKSLESYIINYLNLRIEEWAASREPLTEEQLKNMGLGWLTEP